MRRREIRVGINGLLDRSTFGASPLQPTLQRRLFYFQSSLRLTPGHVFFQTGQILFDRMISSDLLCNSAIYAGCFSCTLGGRLLTVHPRLEASLPPLPFLPALVCANRIDRAVLRVIPV